MTGRDLVTGGLVYVAIGALIWLVLDGLGVIRNTYLKRAARGERPSTAGMVLATLLLILTWPVFVVGVLSALRG